MPEIMHDDPGQKPGIIARILGRVRTDLDTPTTTEATEGFPWTYAEPGTRPIGSLFPTTDNITDEEYHDFVERYPMGRAAVELPVDEAYRHAIVIKIDGKESDRANILWKKYRAEWKRHFKLVRIYGYADMLYGWIDDMGRWQETPPAENLKYDWLLTVPKRYVQNLEETDTLPNKVKSLSVGHGETTIVLCPERFTHTMLPKLTSVSMEGESILDIMYNLLQVQIHADWSIGQALFRRASGLLALFAPKRNVPDDQKESALGSVANHNSKTTLYIPFGWNIKDVLKPGGNMAIARTYYLVTEQMAAATGIPEPILTKKKSPVDATTQDRELFYDMVDTFREDVMRPALTEWVRKSQVAGMIEPGSIEIVLGPLESRSDLEKERELTELGALRLLQKRIELTADQTGTITYPLAEGSPDTPELVKMITKKK